MSTAFLLRGEELHLLERPWVVHAHLLPVAAVARFVFEEFRIPPVDEEQVEVLDVEHDRHDLQAVDRLAAPLSGASPLEATAN